MVGVKQVGNERQVEPRVSSYKRRRCEIFLAPDIISILEDLGWSSVEDTKTMILKGTYLFRTRSCVRRPERCKGAFLFTQLMQKIGIADTVRNIAAEIIDPRCMTS
jgi:hypothetical protein